MQRSVKMPHATDYDLLLRRSSARCPRSRPGAGSGSEPTCRGSANQIAAFSMHGMFRRSRARDQLNALCSSRDGVMLHGGTSQHKQGEVVARRSRAGQALVTWMRKVDGHRTLV